MTVIYNAALILSSTEIFCGYPFQLAEVPLISCDLLRPLIALYQNLSVIFKSIYSEDALHVG